MILVCPIVCIFVSSFLGRIDALALPFRRLRSTTSVSAPSGGGGSKRGVGMQLRGRGREDDFDADDKYAYVHPSIRRVLVMEPRDFPLDDDDTVVKMDAYTIRWNVLEQLLDKDSHTDQKTISMEQLVTLASHCDSVLFRDFHKGPPPTVPSPIRGLLRILPKDSCADQKHRIDEDGGEYFLVATLLVLNMVENSIRHLVGKRSGRAPLLKDMIEMMANREGEISLPKSLVCVLRTLLLPTNGLNLRNLLWHGFLPAIPRRWLSLSIVLTLSLDELVGSSSFEVSSFDGNPNANIAAMRNHTTLVNVLDQGKEILASPKTFSSFEEKMIDSNIVPKSHTKFFGVGLEFVQYPVIFASVVGPLIEHILRLMWCEENKQNKRIAEPGSYYVTLDGHGQKDKHEIIVMPFFRQQGVAEDVRNKLVHRLGGSTMAFLMDMFTSPSGGPNIRATVAHGSFNNYLFKELNAIQTKGDNRGTNNNDLRGMTFALLSVLSALCEDGQYPTGETDGVWKDGAGLISYQPCFSYTALLLAEVGNMVNSMESFYDLIRDGRHVKYSINVSQNRIQIETAQKLAAMSPSFEAIIGLQGKICRNFGKTGSKFTDESFFRECANSSIAAECGAAKLLLSELSEAASLSLQHLNNGISSFQREEIELSSRRRKQVSRMCDTAQLTLDFYSFAAYCALLYIERRQNTANRWYKNDDTQMKIDEYPTNDELFVAVKRSRMVLSTFSTTNTFDRALRALAQYVAGKAVKSVAKIV